MARTVKAPIPPAKGPIRNSDLEAFFLVFSAVLSVCSLDPALWALSVVESKKKERLCLGNHRHSQQGNFQMANWRNLEAGVKSEATHRAFGIMRYGYDHR